MRMQVTEVEEESKNESASNPLRIDGLGTAMKQLRCDLGLDGSSFASNLGIDASTLSKYECEKRGIPFEIFERMAGFTGQSPVALLVWCMRNRFPELGRSSNEIADFLREAILLLEKRIK